MTDSDLANLLNKYKRLQADAPKTEAQAKQYYQMRIDQVAAVIRSREESPQ